MYRIAVLTDKEDRRRLPAGWVRKAGAVYGMFPAVEPCEDTEQFFYTVQETKAEAAAMNKFQ